MRLAGKVAIVTGAGSGFGEGIARRFADEGAKVVIADINAETGQAVADAINKEGADRAVFVRTDVSDSASTAAMVKTATDSFGGLDILVQNAAIGQSPTPLVDTTEEVFDRLFRINVKSVYLGAKHAVPALRARGGGSIINTVSTAAIRPRPFLAAYNATKGALVPMSKALALELAPDKIRVNGLCPVAGETPMLKDFLGEGDHEEKHAGFVATVPLGRLSLPSDIAAAALFLASDEAAFITGVMLEIDGGRCI